MSSSATARVMLTSSTAANSDLARQSTPIYSPLDPNTSSGSSKIHGSMMDDLIRNMYESSDGGGDPTNGGKMDGGGGVDGSGGFNGVITLEEYLKEDVGVPPAAVGFGVMDPATVMSQQHQQEQIGVECGGGGRGRGRKRPMLDPVDRAAMQRQKRMIKNRESAARSRERKQAYTVELESLVTQLEEENARLIREQEELHRQRLKQLMENLIPVTERKKPPRSLRRTQTMQW